MSRFVVGRQAIPTPDIEVTMPPDVRDELLGHAFEEALLAAVERARRMYPGGKIVPGRSLVRIIVELEIEDS